MNYAYECSFRRSALGRKITFGWSDVFSKLVVVPTRQDFIIRTIWRKWICLLTAVVNNFDLVILSSFSQNKFLIFSIYIYNCIYLEFNVLWLICKIFFKVTVIKLVSIYHPIDEGPGHILCIRSHRARAYPLYTVTQDSGISSVYGHTMLGRILCIRSHRARSYPLYTVTQDSGISSVYGHTMLGHILCIRSHRARAYSLYTVKQGSGISSVYCRTGLWHILYIRSHRAVAYPLYTVTQGCGVSSVYGHTGLWRILCIRSHGSSMPSVYGHTGLKHASVYDHAGLDHAICIRSRRAWAWLCIR